MQASWTRRAAFGALVVGMASAAFATVPDSWNVSGTYAAQGRNPDGTPYAGEVQIVDVNGDITMQWHIGGTTFDGMGFRDGRVVVVNWGDSHPVVYVMMPDASLHGTWSDGQAVERLVP